MLLTAKPTHGPLEALLDLTKAVTGERPKKIGDAYAQLLLPRSSTRKVLNELPVRSAQKLYEIALQGDGPKTERIQSLLETLSGKHDALLVFLLCLSDTVSMQPPSISARLPLKSHRKQTDKEAASMKSRRLEYKDVDFRPPMVEVATSTKRKGFASATLNSSNHLSSLLMKKSDPKSGLFGALINGKLDDDSCTDLLSLPPLDGCGGISLLERLTLRTNPNPPQNSSDSSSGGTSIETLTCTSNIWMMASGLSNPNPKPTSWKAAQPTSEAPLSYLTEAGPDVELRVIKWIESRALVPRAIDTCHNETSILTSAFVEHASNAILGLASPSFDLDVSRLFISPRKGLRILPCSLTSSRSIANSFARVGSLLLRLEHYANCAQGPLGNGCVGAAVGSAVIEYIVSVRKTLVSKSRCAVSALSYAAELCNIIRQLHFMTRVLGIRDDSSEMALSCCSGVRLIQVLFTAAVDETGLEHEALACKLFAASSTPLLRFLEEWLLNGVFWDPTGEFGLDTNLEALSTKSTLFWDQVVKIQDRSSWPHPFQNILSALVTAGKSLMLLKQCVPHHFLCSATLPPLRFQIIFDPAKFPAVAAETYAYAAALNSSAASHAHALRERLAAKELARRQLLRRRTDRARQALRIRQQDTLLQQQLRAAKTERARQVAQEGIEAARASRLAAQEMERCEEERVASIVAQKRDKMERLIEEASAEANAKYREREEQLRQHIARQQWRQARFALNEQRLSHLDTIAADEQLQLSMMPKNTSRNTWGTVTSSLPSNIMMDPTLEVQVSNTLQDNKNETEDDSPSVPDSTVKAAGGRSEPFPPVHVSGSSVQNLMYPGTTKDSIQESSDNINQGSSASRDYVQSNVREISAMHPSDSTIQNLLYPSPTSATDDNTKEENPSASPLILDMATEQKETSSLDADQYAAKRDFGGGSFCNLSGVNPYVPLNKQVNLLEAHVARAKEISATQDQEVHQPINVHFASQSQLIPCTAVVQQCLMTPLNYQLNACSTAVVEYFIDELNIWNHFESVRTFILCGSGEWGLSLTQGLIKSLEFYDGKHVLPQQLASTVLFQEALASSFHDTHEGSKKVSFTLSSQGLLTVDASSLSILDWLGMSYDASWPLNIVLSPSAINKYSSVFKLLIKVKRAVCAMQDVRMELRDTHAITVSQMDLRLLEATRHEMLSVVTSLEQYLINQIHGVSWTEFRAHFDARLAGGSKSITSLDHLLDKHNTFLTQLIYRCLLSEGARPVMEVIEGMLALVLKFRGQFRAQSRPWKTSEGLDRIRRIHARFRQYSSFIFTVTTKLVERGYQPHLDELLLRLDWNGFLSKCAQEVSE